MKIILFSIPTRSLLDIVLFADSLILAHVKNENLPLEFDNSMFKKFKYEYERGSIKYFYSLG